MKYASLKVTGSVWTWKGKIQTSRKYWISNIEREITSLLFCTWLILQEFKNQKLNRYQISPITETHQWLWDRCSLHTFFVKNTLLLLITRLKNRMGSVTYTVNSHINFLSDNSPLFEYSRLLRYREDDPTGSLSYVEYEKKGHGKPRDVNFNARIFLDCASSTLK